MANTKSRVLGTMRTEKEIIDDIVNIDFSGIEMRMFKFFQEKKVPSFTMQHYNAIAEVIYKERVRIKTTSLHRDGEPDAITENALTRTNSYTLAMCKLFEKDNPKFKQMQFIAACNRDLVE